jgi:hypothetical protein
LCAAAYRWAWFEQDLRVSAAVQEVFAATYLDGEDFNLSIAAEVAAGDALVHDAVVFDLGLLNDYLDVRAGPAVLQACPRIASWAKAPTIVVQWGGLRGDRLIVNDHVRQREIEVLHTGEALGTDRDDWHVGRIVDSCVQPSFVFAERPVAVGERAGRRLIDVLSAGGDWRARLAALFPIIRDGDLSSQPGWLAAAADLSSGSSIREEAFWLRESAAMDARAPAPRQQELMADGLSRQDAECFCVLEMALDTVLQDLPEVVEIMAQHAAIALARPQVRRAARARLTRPENTDAWQRLANCLPAHARGPFDDLANVG